MCIRDSFRAFNNKKTGISNIADHLISMNHSITNITNNMGIVEINNNKNDIIQLEKLYIYTFIKNMTNYIYTFIKNMTN